MSLQEFLQQFRIRMEREAVVLDLPLFLEFLYIVPQSEFIVFPVVGPLEGMQQIVVEITCAGTLEAGFEFLLHGFRVGRVRCSDHLGCQGKALPGIPFHQCLTDGFFRAGISECGIEVGTAGLQEEIHHFLGLFHINRRPVCQTRETHKSETELQPGMIRLIQHTDTSYHPSGCLYLS